MAFRTEKQPMNAGELVFDLIEFYKQIGMHPDHIKQRQQYEQRLMLLKQQGKLYERVSTKIKSTSDSANCNETSSAATKHRMVDD